MGHFGTKTLKFWCTFDRKTYFKLINILILYYFIVHDGQNRTKLLKENKFLMATTIPYGDNSEMECLRVVVQGLENKAKSLFTNFKSKFNTIQREDIYRDGQVKLLHAELEAKIAASNNYLCAR